MSHTFSVCQRCNSINKVSTDKALANQAVCGKCGSNLKLHGLVTNVTAENFQRILKASDKPVIVDFWAEWCGPCKMYGPEFEKASKTTPGAVFLKVNTETEQALSGQLGIRGIPCTIVFKNGKEVHRQAGAMSAAQVTQIVSQL